MSCVAIPSLRTERLLLRGYTSGDLDRWVAVMGDPAVMRALGRTRAPERSDAWDRIAWALGQWALRGYGLFAVESEGVLIGHAGILHPFDWPEPELAYTIARPAWGRGFAAEAARAARDWAFRSFPFPHLASFIAPDNVRSQRVAERLGAVREDAIVLRGHPAERWVHARPGSGTVV